MISKIRHKEFEVLRVAAEFNNLPFSLNGFTILHLTDFHFEKKDKKFEALKYMAGRVRTDIAAITGDFANTEEGISLCKELVSEINTHHGIYCVLGNHDYYRGEKKIMGSLKQKNLFFLVNRNKKLKTGKGELDIIGIDVSVSDDILHSVLNRADLKKALKGTGKNFKILLAHSPDIIKDAAANKIDFVLAGHTHGGQVRFPFIGALYAASKFGTKYASGLFEEGSTKMFVNKGIGQTKVNFGNLNIKIPFTSTRILCPPEIAIIELKKNRAKEEMG